MFKTRVGRLRLHFSMPQLQVLYDVDSVRAQRGGLSLIYPLNFFSHSPSFMQKIQIG